jgi:ELWxxDGT repeat protein
MGEAARELADSAAPPDQETPCRSFSDPPPGVETGYPESFDPPQALVGGTIYFLGRSGDTDVLRAYKGGAGGSVVVATLPGAAGPLTAVGNRLFFLASLAAGPATEQPFQLWTSDGTTAGTAGTRLVHEIRGPQPSALPDHLTALGNRLFFTACDGTARELWQTAGSATTTRKVVPLAGVDCTLKSSGSRDSAVLVATSKALFLLAPLAPLSPEDGALLRTDGTDGGTVVLATLPGVSGPAAVFGDRPWFATEDDSGTIPEITWRRRSPRPHPAPSPPPPTASTSRPTTASTVTSCGLSRSPAPAAASRPTRTSA